MRFLDLSMFILLNIRNENDADYQNVAIWNILRMCIADILNINIFINDDI